MKKEEKKSDILELTSDTSLIRRILRERAALMSIPITLDVVNSSIIDGMGFYLADEMYLIDMNFVVEVIHIQELTPLPCCPPFIMGITNVRGRILSIISLKSFLDLPEKGITNHNQVIIVRHKNIEIGLLVDEVAGEKPVFLDQLIPAIPTLTAKQKEYLIGVAKDGSIMLDIEKFLSDGKIVIDDEV